jgi:hypothetical protein
MMNKTYLVGSKLLRLDNCGDTDYVYFDKGLDFSPAPNYHYIQYSAKELDFILKLFKSRPNNCLDFISYLFQFSSCFHPESDYPVTWNVFEDKKAWVKALNVLMTDKGSYEKFIDADAGVLKKEFYNVAYQYYMIIESSPWLSKHNLDIVQKIHDRKMDINYFNFLKKKIAELLTSLEIN